MKRKAILKRFINIKNTRASVSIMLSVLMLPVYTFAGVIVDGARISSAKQMVSGAGELAMNSALSSYDDVLKSVYGLFAMSQTQEELEENLTAYFNDTLDNSSINESGDENTRNYLNSIRSIFSDPENMNFDNLVNVSTESFAASGVEGAVLANPVVMKNQIIEYMKYLGPVSIGKGFIAKLGVLKDFNKQSNVVEKKVSYEEKINDIQNTCNNIYQSINSYKTLLNGRSSFDTSQIKNDIERVRKIYMEVSEYLIMLNSALLQINDISSSDSFNGIIRDEALKNNCSEFDYIRDSLGSFISFDINGSGGYTINDTQFMSEYNYFDTLPLSDENDIEYVYKLNQQLISEVSSYNVVYTLLENYEKYYNKLSHEERNTLSKEYDFYMQYRSGIENHIHNAHNIRGQWEDNIRSYSSEASDILNGWYETSDNAVKYLKEASASLSDLISKTDEVKRSGEEWNNSISELSDGDIKSSMKSEYESTAKSLNKDDILALKAAVDDNLSGFENLRDSIVNITFKGQSIYNHFDYVSEYSDSDISYNVCNESQVYGEAQNIMNKHFHTNGDIQDVNCKEIGSGYAFYDYLSQICANTETQTCNEENNDNFKNTLNSLGKSKNINETDLSRANSDNISDQINQDTVDLIQALSHADMTSDSYSVSDPESNDEDKMLDNQQGIMESTSDFLINIGDLALKAAGDGMDKIYLTEYITEMFSCYTSDKQCEGKSIKTIQPETLSGVQISPENNVFYKSEAEYILWGNDEMKKNHQYTNALLFGTRFVLNNIYAFTDAEIKSSSLAAATAIAGWTGFGVPIVRTVIIMSLSLAESVIDVNQLLDGGAVPVYKTRATWNMKPSGMINMIKNNGTELAEMAAKKTGEKIDDVFGKLDKLANDETDKITSTVHEYIDQTSQQVADEAVNAIMTPIDDAVSGIINYSDEVITQEHIQKIISDKLNIAAGSNDGDDIASIARNYAVELANEKISEISQIIYNQYRTVADGAKEKTDEIRSRTTDEIRKIIDPFTEKINARVDEYSDKIKQQVSQGILKSGDKAKEYACDMVTKYITGASTALTEKMNTKSEISFQKADKSTMGKTVTLTYQEYLKIFIMLNSLSENKETAMLSRISTLIHINMNSGMNNIVINDMVYQKPESFDIAKTYTMVKVNASANIRTWFMGVLIPDYNMNPDGSVSYKYDYSNLGKKDKNIIYKSVLSY